MITAAKSIKEVITAADFVEYAKDGPERGFNWNVARLLPADTILIHHVRNRESAQSIIKDGFTQGTYAWMSHLTQRPTRKDDRQGPFAFAWDFSRSMAKLAFTETRNRYSYGDIALVLRSPTALEAFNCADNQWQVVFERKNVQILGLIEAYLGDCFMLERPDGTEVTKLEISWKTCRSHVKKLAASIEPLAQF